MSHSGFATWNQETTYNKLIVSTIEYLTHLSKLFLEISVWRAFPEDFEKDPNAFSRQKEKERF